MKFLAVLAVMLAVVAADVSHVLSNEASAPILKQSYDALPDGSFQYAYETANGIAASAEGHPKNVNNENVAETISGQFRYTAPNGEVVEETYVADENGFQPTGSHIPVGPPIPEQILRALAYIAAHPPPPAKP